MINIDQNRVYFLELKQQKRLLKVTDEQLFTKTRYVIATTQGDERCAWKFTEQEEGYYLLVNPASGLALDNNGTFVYGLEVNRGDYQLWKIIESNGYYSLQNKKTGICIAAGYPCYQVEPIALHQPPVNGELWRITPELKSSIYISRGEEYQFPEQSLEQFKDRINSGLCFSGGGNRAMVAAMGQLRGLTDLNLMDKVGYISCVSGGSWASTIYTYNQLPIEDQTLLGPVMSPSDMTLDYLLNKMDKNCMGNCAENNIAVAYAGGIAHALAAKKPAGEAWCNAVEELYFKQYGIADLNQTLLYSLNQETVDNIKENNPGLVDMTFITPKPNRPYLIINSTIIDLLTDGLDIKPNPQLVGFEFTPLYVGTPHGRSVTYTDASSHQSQKLWIGGGYVNSYAFGGVAPADSPDSSGQVDIPAPALYPTLADASGTSSMAVWNWVKAITDAVFKFLESFGYSDDEIKKLLTQYTFIPSYPYWPVDKYQEQQERVMTFADGACVDNLGIMPLLLRKVQNITVFINTDVGLSLDYNPTTAAPTDKDMDIYLPALFGYSNKLDMGDISRNQVFKQEDFAKVVNKLQEQKREGKTVLAQTSHTVQTNSWWGVEGNWNVNVCWVYNDKVQAYNDLLPQDTQAEIAAGKEGKLNNFPLFNTVTQQDMNIPMIKLLADLSCWNILQNETIFKSMIP